MSKLWLPERRLHLPRMSGGAGSLVSHVEATQGGSGAGPLVSSAINTTGSTLIVVADAYYEGHPTTTMADSKSNTYVSLTAYASANPAIRLRYASASTGTFVVGTSHTFTLTGASSFWSYAVGAFGGTDPANGAPDVSNGSTSAGSGTIQTGSITPNYPNELIVTGLSGGASGTYSIGSGFSIAGQNNGSGGGGGSEGVALAWLDQTTAVAINPTWSGPWDGSTSFAAAAIASWRTPSVAANSGFLEFI